MKEFLIAAISILFFTTQLSAQEGVEVSLGEPYKVFDARDKTYVNSDDYIISLKTTKGKGIIQSFNTRKMEEVARADFELPHKKAYFKFLLEFGGKFWAFFTDYDKSIDQVSCFAYEIDPETAKYKGAAKKLFVKEGKTFISYQLSENKETLLLSYSDNEKDNNDLSYVRYCSFDSDLKELWTKRVLWNEYVAEGTVMIYSDLTLDNNGDLIAVGILVNEEDRPSRSTSGLSSTEFEAHYFRFIKIGVDEKPMVADIEGNPEKIVKSLMIKSTDDGKIVLGGYYRLPETSKTEGAFTVQTDKSFEEFSSSYYEIPMDILNAYESKRTAKKNEKNEEEAGMSWLQIEDIGIDEDGSVFLMGEQQFITSHTRTSSQGGTYTYTNYRYDHILVTKIDSDGSLDWMKKLPKKNSSDVRGISMTYKLLENEDSYYFIYMDDEKNWEIGKDEELALCQGKEKGNFIAKIIDKKSGVVSTKLLFNMDEVNDVNIYQFRMNRVVQIGSDYIAAEVYKKKKEDIWIKVNVD